MQTSTSLSMWQPKPVPHTKPDVFILESVGLDDEADDMFEGRVLASVLRMCGKSPAYYYFRTKEELERLALVFRDSGCRYLHVSTHGDARGIYTTLNHHIDFAEFARIFANTLKTKRLFVSACEVGGRALCEAIAGTNKGIQSVAAPATSIQFTHAVALWTSLYVRAFSEDTDGMRHHLVRETLESLCALFKERFHLSLYAAEKDDWNHHTVGP